MAAPSGTSSDAAGRDEVVESVRSFFESYYLEKRDYFEGREERMAALEEELAAESPSAQIETMKRQAHYAKESEILRGMRKRTKVSDFQTIKMIGKGGYGEVFLVRKIDTDEVLALKKMRKEFVLASDKEVAHIRTERNVLAIQESQWLIKLVYAFQDRANIYMCMEYAPGGDLRTLISNACPFNDDSARFYIAEMFLAVDALHKQGYIHRDLKPENFLIDAEGHLKLTDFGLSKGNMMYTDSNTMKGKRSGGRVNSDERRNIKDCYRLFGTMRKGPRTMLAYSLVGSPDYMAVEMLKGDGYDFTVDHWALACILFEMMTGFPPFAGTSIEDVFNNVYNWEATLNYGDIDNYMSQECWALIRAVLCDHKDRIGVGGFHEITAHAYFSGFDFANIRDMTPPFQPELTDPLSTQYFDQYEGSLEESVNEDEAAESSERSAFHAFTYVRPKRQASES